MTFADVLGRDLRIEWHEAVALVRDVIEQSDEAVSAVPDLDQVELLAWGQVQLHGGVETANPAESLAQMLQVLLVRADPPVQLRLAISQPQGSVRAFSEALGFFERPDRSVVLQQLYNRASAALPLPDSDPVTSIEYSAPDPNLLDTAHDKAPRGRRQVYAAGLLILALAIGAAVVYANRVEGAPGSTLTDKVANGVDDVASAIGSAVSAVSARVGLRPAENTAPQSTPSGQTATAAPPARGASAKRLGLAPVPPQSRLGVEGFDLESTGSTRPIEVPNSEAAANVLAGRASIGKTSDREAREATVYSVDSPGVSAPIGVRPQLPNELPPGLTLEDLTRIELVITTAGTVESVKMLGEPKTVHDSMLLSAAKAWQFHPAMKDGIPVRYRKVVWVGR